MIRLARPADLPDVRLVELSAATVFVGTHMDFAANHAPNAAADLIDAISRQLMWVASIDDEIAGFVFAEPCPEGASPEPCPEGASTESCPGGLYVRELSVAAPQQKRGLGAALMATLIAAARARKDRLLVLTTDRTLPWNAPFYAKLGFSIVEGFEIPAIARQRLERQYAAGFDPAHRCAMVMPL